MKKQHLLKSMLLLCALVVGSGSLWATNYNKVDNPTSGKSYIVVSSGYAITASSPSSGYVGRTNVSASISGTVLTTNSTNIVWVMTSSGTGDNQVWTFKNGSNWLLNNSGTTYRNMGIGTTPSSTSKNEYKIKNNKIWSTGATAKYLNCVDGGFRMYDSNQGTYTFEFYEKEEEKVLSSITISGSPTKTTYTEGETFDPTGLVVTGTYSDSSSDNVTASASFDCTPNILEYGTTSVSVVATVSAVVSSAYDVDVIVNEATKYTVTIADGITNGSLAISKGGASVSSGTKIIPGTTLTITCTPDPGYRFSNWQYYTTKWNTRYTNPQDYEMPESDVSFRATFEAIPQYTYSWSVNSTIVKSETLYEGEDVVFPDVDDMGGKVFYGWVTTSTVDPSDEPSLVSTTSVTATGNTTYYAVFATRTPGTYTETTDDITRSTTGVSAGATSYTNWSGKTVSSDAVYAGNSAGGASASPQDAIQIRTTNSNSGIVSTASGGNIKKVTVIWSDGSYTGTTLNVYASSSAYEAASDLYSGDALGTIVKGTSTEYTITGNYQYVGIRSNNNALCFDKVSFTWGNGTPDTYSNFSTSIPVVAITPGKTYTTYVTSDVLDFTSSSELTAYIATAASSSAVTLTSKNKVPSGTPVVLKATTTGSPIFIDIAASGDDVTGNLLLAGDGSTTIGGDSNYDYILSDGKFYRAESGTVEVGKAYLHLASAPSSAHALDIIFEENGEVTGIAEVNNKKSFNGDFYNLAGQKIAQPTKGLYIVNGRKVVIK